MTVKKRDKPRRQTTKLNGKRVVITTTGKGKVSIKPATILEEDLQTAQCVALRMSPLYGKAFLFAGDMSAAKRGPKAQAMASRTGMIAGEPDLRIYLNGGGLLLIENKTNKGKLSNWQIKRHKELAMLGHDVVVIYAETPNDAVSKMWAAINLRLNLDKI